MKQIKRTHIQSTLLWPPHPRISDSPSPTKEHPIVYHLDPISGHLETQTNFELSNILPLT